MICIADAANPCIPIKPRQLHHMPSHVIIGAAAGLLLLAPQSAWAAAALDGATLRWPWAIPFIGILITIATGPLLFPKLWHGEGTALATRLALAIETDAEFNERIAPLGGERRLMRWRSSDSELPSLPEEVKATIAQNKACRMLLLTPALFQKGTYGGVGSHLAKIHYIRFETTENSVERQSKISTVRFRFINKNVAVLYYWMPHPI